MVWKTLHPTTVPSAMDRIAAPVTPRLATPTLPPVAAWVTDSKLNAPGTSDQKAASIITIAGGEVLMRAASMANGTVRNAPMNPE